MKLVIFLICLLLAMANSEKFSEIEAYGDVNFPCVGSKFVEKVAAAADKNASTSITFPSVSVVRKYRIRRYVNYI